MALNVAGRPDPVRIPSGGAPDEGRPECASLIAALPDRLGPLTRRRVEGDIRGGAAWGSPAVVLRCGVPAPPRPIGALFTADGVDWTPREDPDGVTWTTVGRPVSVQVRFPARYDSQGPLLATLSPALRGRRR